MKRYGLALDLVDNPASIAAYENWHKAENCWPEIRKSILNAGIIDMQIYRTGNRLFMIMETEDDFNSAIKEEMDANNPIVQKWETMLEKFQQVLPWAKVGEKWLTMDKIFQL
ncbi:L-rhamnose mutarotase [Pedobacter sp. UYEF25]